MDQQGFVVKEKLVFDPLRRTIPSIVRRIFTRCGALRNDMADVGSIANYQVHESSYVDDGCRIGAGTKIWHFCHVMPGAVIGERCNIGQNVVISPDVVLGNNVKVQNNVSIYTGVDARRRRVLRAVDGVHQRGQPAQPCRAPQRVPADAGQARRQPRRQLHRRVRPHHRPLRFRRRRGGRDQGRARLRAGPRQSGPHRRLDVRMRHQVERRRRAAGDGRLRVVRNGATSPKHGQLTRRMQPAQGDIR